MLRQTLLLILAVAATLGAPTRPARADGALEVLSSVPVDGRMSEITFRTPALVDPVRVRVLLPADAAAHPDARYPVLYLLHGTGDDRSTWTTQGRIEELVGDTPVVVVMPDGGDKGWYTDWYNNGGGGPPQWERFHVGELVPWIEANEPVVRGRAGRAIAGVSMGGFGAFSYAARHPDLFVAAGSFSGALDTNDQEDLVGGEPFGPRATAEAFWRGHNPWDLAGNLRGLALQIAAGNGDPGGPLGGDPDHEEAVIERQSASTAARLQALGIARTFDDYGPGAHSWPYWRRDLSQWLPELMKVFAAPPALPTPFTYTSVEQRFTMRGYTLQAGTPTPALRTLEGVAPLGFRLTSPDPVTVRTAARYARRGRYRVVIRAAGRTIRHVVRASAQGRLLFAVPAAGRVGITRVRASS
jgi:S-formylglutathione hydrolase FrmB